MGGLERSEPFDAYLVLCPFAGLELASHTASIAEGLERASHIVPLLLSRLELLILVC